MLAAALRKPWPLGKPSEILYTSFWDAVGYGLPEFAGRLLGFDAVIDRGVEDSSITLSDKKRDYLVHLERRLLIGGEDTSSRDLMHTAANDVYEKHKGANAALYGGLGYLILIATAANACAVYAMELGKDAPLTRIIDEFEHLPRGDTSYHVELELEPVGACFIIHDGNELRSLVASLLATLRPLHEAGYVHRDIRMDNIVRYFQQWILIDWELAGRVDQTVWWEGNCNLLPDPVRLRQHPYTAQTDLWQVGKLIISQQVFASPAAVTFAQQLVNGDFLRPKLSATCGQSLTQIKGARLSQELKCTPGTTCAGTIVPTSLSMGMLGKFAPHVAIASRL
ncbi:g5961 [Coccomyxa elongata]